MIFFLFKCIHLFHQNINGLISKSDLLTLSLDSLENKQQPLDILCITEHNMVTTDMYLLKIMNFRLGSIYCRKKRRGGSCILVRNSLDFTPINNISKFSHENIIECSGIELKEHKLYVICIYRPPKLKKEDIDMFFSRFESLLNRYCRSTKRVIICGDFNINILNKSKESIEFEQMLHSYNLKLGLREPTRLSSGTCIDNFIFNIRGCKSKVFEFALSDHTAQLLVCPVKPSFSLKFWYVVQRDYSKDNLAKFKECIDALSFSDVFNSEDPNTAFNNFFELFHLFYNLCFPWKRIKKSTKVRPKWISKGLRVCCKRKRQLLWEYRKKRSLSNKNKFVALSSRLNNIIKLTQKSQNDNYIKNAPNKSKATWNVINSKKLNTPKDYIQQIIVDNNVITDPVDIANNFNIFFTNPRNLSAPNCSRIQIPYEVNSIFMQPTIAEDIYKIIQNLKDTKSTGYDGISTSILKLVLVKLSHILSYILNLCITNGAFPEMLKLTIIKPLFKKADRYNMGSYRPIALVPVISKIFEKVIHDCVYNYFEVNNLFCSEQIGFRKHKSIDLAIYKFLQIVMTNIDRGSQACALYMDLTKAFDYVDHKILLNKLYAYGVRGNVYDLIKSYLHNRKQVTQITRICPDQKQVVDYSSRCEEVRFGVPQGSVLGPLLFIIYINDLPKMTKHDTILFADDSTILFIGHDKIQLEHEINLTLHDIINWLTLNNLNINISKTNLMTFRNKVNKLTDMDISYSNDKIAEVSITKFLGLNIDEHLNWKQHIESLCKRINTYSYALYMLGKTVSKASVLTAYHGYVAPLLKYGIMFWGNSTDREAAFRAQKRCVRAICNLKQNDSCRTYFIDSNILTLPCMYILEVVLFVKKNMHLYENLNSRRRNYNIAYPTNKTAMLNKSILCMAPRIYNHLPKSILEITNINAFKNKIKTILMKKCYYSINEYLNDGRWNIIL